MDLASFVAAVGATFEHSPWIAEGAWEDRPFSNIDELHATMLRVVNRAPEALQLAFLCAHPELAGREALASTLTPDSEHEQASAGLNAMSREEIEQMRELNQVYRQRHGFPFIIAVRRYTKTQIFEEMQRRTDRDRQAEFAEAMDQISAITRLRLQSVVLAL
jgi:2-oxo-4-hydroxy-4-carboxy-5-ureidoimidazoline decarboxylase